MEQEIEATQVCNTLTYLHLLPEDKQLNKSKQFLHLLKSLYVNIIEELITILNI